MPTIAEAISDLRDQLITATSQGENEQIRFRPQSIELELSLVYGTQGGAEAKAGWHIFSLGVKGDASRQSTHRVKLTLDPVKVMPKSGHGSPPGGTPVINDEQAAPLDDDDSLWSSITRAIQKRALAKGDDTSNDFLLESSQEIRSLFNRIINTIDRDLRSERVTIVKCEPKEVKDYAT
jgi:hypothetical protein